MRKTIFILSTALSLSANAQIITTIAGTGSATYSGDGGQATAAAIYKPYGVAFDATGNLYFTDTYNNRIRTINTSGIITTFAGNGVQAFSGDNGQATAAELYTPARVMPDGSGNVYIVDEDNMRVRKVNSSGVIKTVAGNGTGGFSGDGGQATAAEILRPYGMGLDASGNLYIADTQNGCVRKVNSSGVISTIAGNATTGFSGDNGPATAAELNNPSAIAFDPAGNMYIADAGNNRIRMVNTAGIITTVAGNGTGAFSGDGGQATVAEIKTPRDVAYVSGNLYIADEGNNRIRAVSSSGIISTIVGNGTAGYTGDNGAATAAELNGPTGIAFDATGNLYIGDFFNNRIRKVTNVAVTTAIAKATSIEQATIYPNPNTGIFFIETNTTERQTVQMFDITGKQVLNQIITGKTIIDASVLNQGIYNLNIISKEGIISKRIVVVR
jgi:sugar lactone lactonase YvrE